TSRTGCSPTPCTPGKGWSCATGNTCSCRRGGGQAPTRLLQWKKTGTDTKTPTMTKKGRDLRRRHGGKGKPEMVCGESGRTMNRMTTKRRSGISATPACSGAAAGGFAPVQAVMPSLRREKKDLQRVIPQRRVPVLPLRRRRVGLRVTRHQTLGFL